MTTSGDSAHPTRPLPSLDAPVTLSTFTPETTSYTSSPDLLGQLAQTVAGLERMTNAAEAGLEEYSGLVDTLIAQAEENRLRLERLQLTDGLAARTAELEVEVEDLQAEAALQYSKTLASESEANAWVRECESLTAQLQQLERVAKAGAELQSQRLAALADEAEELQAEAASQYSKYLAAEDEANAWVRECESLTARVQQLEQVAETDAGLQSGRATTLSNEIEELQAALGESESDLAAWLVQAEELEESRLQAVVAAEEFQAQLSAAQSDAEDLRQTLGSFEESARMNAVEIVTLEERIASLEAALHTGASARANIEEERNNIAGHAQVLEAEKATLIRERDKLAKRGRELEAETASLLEDRDTAQQAHRDLAERFAKVVTAQRERVQAELQHRATLVAEAQASRAWRLKGVIKRLLRRS